MASKTEDKSQGTPTKDLSLEKPTDDEKQTVQQPGAKKKTDEAPSAQKLNPNANTVNNTQKEGNGAKTPKETKFNQNSIVSPQSTKLSLKLSPDSNSNHSIKSAQSTLTTSTNNASPSHPNINRTFIKNSKLTITTPSKYNYTKNTKNTNNNDPKKSTAPTPNANATQSRPEITDKKPTSSTSSTYKKAPFDNDLVLQNLIRAQIEYLFSDYHLTNDTYLLARMQDNPQHWLSIDELCHNQKIRCLTIKKERILQALKESKYLQLSPENDRVRRPDFTLPKLKPNRDLRRTVFLYGVAANKTEQDIRKLLSQYGHIKRIHFQPMDLPNGAEGGGKPEIVDDEAPNKAVAQLIMKKKFLFPSRYSQSDRDTDNESNHGGYTPRGGSIDDNASDTGSVKSKRDRMMNDLYSHPIRNPNGDPQDFSHLKTCFVVFESQSQATKCVKARVRAVDGMRCIHKYDYNKVAKKFRTAQMKGEKLSFSPPPPNYNSPRDRQGNYRNHRGQSPGACSTSSNYSNYSNNNRGRYNRTFSNPNNSGNGGYNNNNNNNRGYQSYRDRDRSHSISSTHSNNSNDARNNGGYQSYRTGRYYQRNNSNSQRSQTPNFKPSDNRNNNNSFFNMMGRKNDDNDKENGNNPRNSRRHGLGRRADRNSHDDSHDTSNNNVVRTFHTNNRKYTPITSQNKYQHPRSTQNNPNTSTSPHRNVHSVGNQSTNSDTNKPILYTMNNNKPPPINTNIPPQPKQPQPHPPNTYTPKHNASIRASQPNTSSLPTTSTTLQRSQSATSAASAQSQRSSVPAAPQLYHPIPTQPQTAAARPTQPQPPQLPSREEMAALRSAGYNHELYYLPMDDQDLFYDPLMAYDAYFGVDQSGKPTSTHVAAQQLQAATQAVSSRHSSHSHGHAQHTHHSGAHTPTHSHSHSSHRHNQQYAHTPTHSTSSHSVHGFPQQYQQPPLQHSYSAHGTYSNSASNGARSAPYGPVNTSNTPQASQYAAQQWQLDKLEKFKQQKQAMEAAKKAQQQQQQKVESAPATALSVMSSSN